MSYHVYHSKKQWLVKKGSDSRPASKHRVKTTAIRKGKALAKKDRAELFIHKKSGPIQARHTYGKDPYPPKG